MAMYFNPQYNPYFNPYAYTGTYAPSYNYQSMLQTQSQAQAQPHEDFKWVKSEKEVDDWYVEPNHAAAFWHSEEPVLYLKQADTTGKPTIRTFDLVERLPATEEKQEEPEVKYVTESDFCSVVKEMTDAFSQFKKEIEALQKVPNDIERMREDLAQFQAITSDVEQMRKDMYGIAGKKKATRRADEEDG